MPLAHFNLGGLASAHDDPSESHSVFAHGRQRASRFEGAPQETNLAISVEGSAALVLRIPKDANVTVTGSHTVIQNPNTTFHLWSLADAKTINDAVPRIQEIIKPEFVNFKPTTTNELVITGKPARHISGTGNEADDGDPGAAEVVFFSTSKHVFAVCAHGGFDDGARRSKIMLAVLKTAKAP